MRKSAIVCFSLLVTATLFVCLTAVVRAEDKPGGQSIPHLPKTPDDPILDESHVYPFWGPVCQRYTYSVIYHDKEGRAPEYVRMYFNGDWIDIEKENPDDTDYKQGVKYIYKFVPKNYDSNFYFFEASNGLGKARDGIIESPDNGPVLFESAFNNNEIALIDAKNGEKIWNYPTGVEWIGGLAFSNDGKYLAVQTSRHIYFFETTSSTPKWSYQKETSGPIGGDVKGGIDISADGSKIFASIGEDVLLFSFKSNQPLWQSKTIGSCYNAAISDDGRFMAVANAGEEENIDTNLLVVWGAESNEPLWQYHSSGNFHDVSFSADGSLLAAATGCPDRRGYLFSIDSKEPLWQTEMLTRDAPVHQANISADGSVIAFGSESDGGALFLFSKESSKQQWRFSAPGEPSFRAVSMTSSGQYIGGATTLRGGAYIFDRSSADPVASWKVDASLGAVDIADDGSFLAVGGRDNKVRIFERKSKKERAVLELNEHVGEIDISADGRYVAAGTSASVYFFESLDTGEPDAVCETIIEPEKEPEQSLTGLFAGDGEPILTYCDDGICEGEETLERCPQDCDPNFSLREDRPQPSTPWLLIALCVLVGLLGLGVCLVLIKIKLSKTVKETKGGIKIFLGITLAAMLLASGVVIGYYLVSKNTEMPKEPVNKLEGKPVKQPGSAKFEEGDTRLRAVCQSAAGDYPEWAAKTGIVVWQNSEGGMYFRRSPTDLSVGIDAPVGIGERLGALELIDENNVAYVVASDGKVQKVGIFGLESGPTTVYENNEATVIYDTAFISKDEFLVLSKEKGNITLRRINRAVGTAEVFLQVSSSVADGANAPKIATSPRGTYAYLVDTTIKIIDLADKKQIAEIEGVNQPLWIGDDHLLCSKTTAGGGAFLYDVKSKESYEVTLVDPDATGFSFNPHSGGVLAYNTGQSLGKPRVSVILCQTGEELNSRPQAVVEGLTDQETAIVISRLKDTSSSTGGLTAGQSGFWQFVDKSWEVKLADGLAEYYSQPLVATAWNRY